MRISSCGACRELLANGAKTGRARNAVVPDELASYGPMLSLRPAACAPRKRFRRLVKVTLAGLHPP